MQTNETDGEIAELEMAAASAAYLIPAVHQLQGNWDKRSILAFLVAVQTTSEKMLDRRRGRTQ